MLKIQIWFFLWVLDQQIDKFCRFPNLETDIHSFWDLEGTRLVSYGIKHHLYSLDYQVHVRLFSALEIDSAKWPQIDTTECPHSTDHSPALRFQIRIFLWVLDQQIDSDCRFPNLEANIHYFWDLIGARLVSYGRNHDLYSLECSVHHCQPSGWEIDSGKSTMPNDPRLISQDVLTLLITALPLELQSEFSSSC